MKMKNEKRCLKMDDDDDDDDDDDVREQHNTTTQTRKKERKKERKKNVSPKKGCAISRSVGVSRRSRLSSLVFFCGVLLSPPLLKKEKERQKATFLGFQKDTI